MTPASATASLLLSLAVVWFMVAGPVLAWVTPRVPYYRSRIVGLFMAAIPISNILGSIVSGVLLNLNGWLGLAGWQWLFILEAAPAIMLGFVVYFYLTDWPSGATWLHPAQRDWLVERLSAERAQRDAEQESDAIE